MLQCLDILTALGWACSCMSCFCCTVWNIGVDAVLQMDAVPQVCASEYLEVGLFIVHLPDLLGQLMSFAVTFTLNLDF